MYRVYIIFARLLQQKNVILESVDQRHLLDIFDTVVWCSAPRRRQLWSSCHYQKRRRRIKVKETLILLFIKYQYHAYYCVVRCCLLTSGTTLIIMQGHLRSNSSLFSHIKSKSVLWISCLFIKKKCLFIFKNVYLLKKMFIYSEIILFINKNVYLLKKMFIY